MTEFLQEIGPITRCTAEEYSRGLMEEDTKGIMFRTRKKARESLFGLMVAATTGHGLMENSMGSEGTLPHLGRLKLGNGLMEKDIDGLTNDIKPLHIQSRTF
jgi:hypothetical protein